MSDFIRFLGFLVVFTQRTLEIVSDFDFGFSPSPPSVVYWIAFKTCSLTMTFVTSTLSLLVWTLLPECITTIRTTFHNISDLLRCSFANSWCETGFKSILLDKFLVCVVLYHYYLLCFVFVTKKREPVFSSLYNGGNWKSWVLYNFLEYIGDVGLMITYNFRLGFFHTLNFTSISYDSSS